MFNTSENFSRPGDPGYVDPNAVSSPDLIVAGKPVTNGQVVGTSDFDRQADQGVPKKIQLINEHGEA